MRGNEFGEKSYSVSASASARPSPSLQFSVAPSHSNEGGTNATLNGPINRQYLTTMDGDRPEVYNKRYIFGLVDRTTFSTQFRVSYVLKPDVTLDVYAEPFAASGRYLGIGGLAGSRGRDLRIAAPTGRRSTAVRTGAIPSPTAPRRSR